MLTVKRGDLFPDVEETVLDEDGVAVDVSGATVTFFLRHSRDPGVTLLDGKTGSVVNGPTGDIKYTWQSGDTERDPGTYEYEFKIVPVVGDPYRVPTVGFGTVVIEDRIGTA